MCSLRFRVAALLSVLAVCVAAADAQTYTEMVHFGAIADIHYTQNNSAALNKTQYFVDTMTGLNPDFVIELGDFIQASTTQVLQQLEAVYQGFGGPTYHALGNHDLDSISKADFLANVTNTGVDPNATHYSWNVIGLHMVVLDACYRQDGVPYDSGNFSWTDTIIPQSQLDWLSADLAASSLPTMVFVHQTLDRADSDSLNVKNGTQVRSILESDGGVMAVFSGHLHGGGYSQINGIHYFTLEASTGGTDPISGNAFSLITVGRNDNDALHYQIALQGYGRQDSRTVDCHVVPEPSTFALAAFGLLRLIGFGRLRKR